MEVDGTTKLQFTKFQTFEEATFPLRPYTLMVCFHIKQDGRSFYEKEIVSNKNTCEELTISKGIGSHSGDYTSIEIKRGAKKASECSI